MQLRMSFCYEIPVYRCQLVRETSLALAERVVLTNPAEAAKLLTEYLQGSDREHFVVILLDTKNRVIGLNTVSVGILDSSLVHPREVYKPAILSNAASILVAHNHPSGQPEPSAEDKRITERLHQAGKILGIDLIDHVILGDEGRFISLQDRGVLSAKTGSGDQLPTPDSCGPVRRGSQASVTASNAQRDALML